MLSCYRYIIVVFISYHITDQSINREKKAAARKAIKKYEALSLSNHTDTSSSNTDTTIVIKRASTPCYQSPHAVSLQSPRPRSSGQPSSLQGQSARVLSSRQTIPPCPSSRVRVLQLARSLPMRLSPLVSRGGLLYPPCSLLSSVGISG